MKQNTSFEAPQPQHRFLNREDVQDTLVMTQERLDALNYDYHNLSLDKNPGNLTHPYEQVTLFTIDTKPSDRASAVAQSTSYGINLDRRIEFAQQNIFNHRVNLSQTALGVAIGLKSPLYMNSLMNKDHRVWAHPLLVEGNPVAAVQLAFTVDHFQTKNWKYPESSELEHIFKKHKDALTDSARVLAAFSLQRDSLSRSLEINPPTTPDSFMISWDVINSSKDVLSPRYATHEEYVRTFKGQRAILTDPFKASALDRGDGEHVIIPIRANLNNPADIQQFGRKNIPPLLEKLQFVHGEVAQAYAPDLFPKVRYRVGLGNFEESQEAFRTSQSITEALKMGQAYGNPHISYTQAAHDILLPE